MKRFAAVLVCLAVLLCGCDLVPPRTTQPASQPTEAPVPQTTELPVTVPATQAPTEPPTEAPTEPPVLRNPFSGYEVPEPWTQRPFAVSIGNGRGSLPHMGVSMADVLFESFVNGSTTRRFALYSDIAGVDAIGGSRSMRLQFTDMAQGYDAIAVYAGGSDTVMGDLSMSGIDGIIAQQWGEDYHYRDTSRGLEYEHNLIVKGQGLVDYAESQGYALHRDGEIDAGFRFTETPDMADGETAETFTVHFTMGSVVKDTLFTYYPEALAYSLSQYGSECVDGYYYVLESFKNVFVVLCPATNIGVYHFVDTVGEGEGYFACEGKMIPIRWSRESDASPFRFFRQDGTPLEQGIGSSYIALATSESTVSCGSFETEAPEE